MKKVLSVLLIFLLVFTTVAVPASAEEGRCEIYVATDGDDQNDGSKEKPLASVNAAKEKIREMKKEGLFPKGYVVYIREGTYSITESIVLTQEDSGTAEAPVTYRAYRDEKVVFSGGVSVSGKDFVKVTDEKILNRIVEQSAKNQIYMLDLKKFGINEVDAPYWKGAYSYSSGFIKDGLITKPTAPASEVLFNGKALTLARYPNDDNLYVDGVIEVGWDFDEPDRVPRGTPFTIKVSDNRIKYWTQAPEDSILMYGFWKWAWADQTVPIHNIDVEKQEITSGISSVFGVIRDQPFYVFNLFEEIDVPGEYYIDKENCILYMYPPANLEKAEVVLTMLDKPIVQLKNTQYVTFKGIDLLGARSNAFVISEGSHNVLMDSEISFTASKAVTVSGKNNGILNCYIHDVEGGVSISGGNYETLEPGENYVTNCEFERFSRLSATYVQAVSLGGVGNVVSYNEIHDAPHLAIEFSGNNNKIIYNEIYDVVQSTDDAGAIYSGLTWVSRGTEIKYNYIHDLSLKNAVSSQGAGLGGIYLDGGQCETFMIGNVVENVAGRALWLNGGRDNVAINNVVINCNQGLLFSDIMKKVDLTTHHYPRLEAAPYVTNEIWQKAYPKLQEMLKLPDSEKVEPEGNIYFNNLCYKSEIVNHLTDQLKEDTSIYLDYTQNYQTESDPGFYDVVNRNYTIKADSEVFAKLPGFMAVPFTRMGRLTERAELRIDKATVLAINSPYSFVNGEKTKIDTQNESVVPFIKEGRTYVPLRFLAESLGATVTFDKATGLVTIASADINLTLPSKGTDAIKNGEQIVLESPTLIIQERTMVPLREISELFDKSVFWHNAGFISVSDDPNLFDENGTDEEIIQHLYNALNIY